MESHEIYINKVYIILESRNNFGTQWCPKDALSSNFFYCDEERTLKIDAKRLCDGHPDCPLSKADESSFVCTRDELRFKQALSVHIFPRKQNKTKQKTHKQGKLA